ncbi:MAG: hypothetical protein [Circular genetic element sp.]|nr:MAG: hypothetical protein [Circular genetic element sp.]
MQKLEKFYPHNTMQEFMATLNEETLEGVFTMRLTPSKFKKDEKKWPYPWDGYKIVEWLQELQKQDKIQKCMCFREFGDKVGEHFHIRFVTKFKTRQSLANLVKERFPIPKGAGKGNSAYAIRDCKAKDKTLWKSATYIAKDGDCIYRHGYALEDIKYFVEYSTKLREFRGYPKFEQIILRYQLDKRSTAELTGKLIYDSVINYHKLMKQEIPPLHRVQNIMHNICFKLSPIYRSGFEETIQTTINWKLQGNFQ